MLLDRTAEPSHSAGECYPIVGVKHQRLYVTQDQQPSVDMRLDVVVEVVSHVPDPGRTPSAESGVERRLLLLAALGRLTERQRGVLVLRYFDDLSEADIAHALGVSVGTVKSTAHLALRRLRELAPELSDLLPLEIS